MDLLPSAEQEQLRDAVRGLLADGAEKVWARLGHELGVLGLSVPEELGGSSAGQTERAVVAEELGRALTPTPFLGSTVLAVDTLLLLDDDVARTELVPGLVTGDVVGAVAVAEAGGGGLLEPGTTTTVRDGRLYGTKNPVLDAEGADVLLVLADDGDGPAVFRVDPAEPGVTIIPLTPLDLSRSLARVVLDGAAGVRLDGDASRVLAEVARRATVVLGAGQVGGMARATELTVAYAKERMQFGRAIGSYQAVKHQLADMYVAQELSLGLYRRAAWVADHEPDRLGEAAHLLAAHAGPAYVEVARSMVHLHGGIGYTWEHEAHRHYRRAYSDERLLGSAAQHRAHIATLLEI